METKKNGLALKDELTTQIMKRRDIRANSKLVLIGILNRVDWSTWKSSTGYKIVSQRDLADLCGTHLATVNSCIEQLEKVKLIERDVFKSTRTTAPPIKVNIELIQHFARSLGCWILCHTDNNHLITADGLLHLGDYICIIVGNYCLYGRVNIFIGKHFSRHGGYSL